MRSPAHNHFHHMSAFILHSYQPAGPSTLAHGCQRPFSYSLKLQEGIQILPPGAQGLSTCKFHFALRWGSIRDRGNYTPDVPAIFHQSLEDVIRRSSSLGGQDYDTSLLPEIKGKPIPVTKLRGRQEKHWTCHNLALSIHLFIRKCWCKLGAGPWGCREEQIENNPLTQRIYCLLAETNITQVIICLTMKSSLWNNNDKTRTLSKPLQQAGCPFPYLLRASVNRSHS